MFGIVASDYPKVIITKDYAVMQAKVSASMYVNNDKSMELAFTLALVSRNCDTRAIILVQKFLKNSLYMCVYMQEMKQ